MAMTAGVGALFGVSASGMKIVAITTPGGPEVLQLADAPDPRAGARRSGAGRRRHRVNRADLLQRQGLYPPPAGAVAWPGLEASGMSARWAQGVRGWTIGDAACALLAGGGYAEKVAVPAGQLLPVPRGVSLVDAAALPEVACTVWSNVFMLAGLRAGECLLVHGGVQRHRHDGHPAGASARRARRRDCRQCGKLERCRELGADILMNYRSEDFVADVARRHRRPRRRCGAGHHGREVPGSRTRRAGAAGATWSSSACRAAVKAEIDLAHCCAKRGTLHATALRAQSVEEKSAIVASVREHVWPLLESGAVHPVVHVAPAAGRCGAGAPPHAGVLARRQVVLTVRA